MERKSSSDYFTGFHKQYCHIKKVVEEVIEKPIKPVPAQEEPAEEVTSESSKLGWIALPVVLVALGIIALIFYKYKSHQRKQSPSDSKIVNTVFAYCFSVQ